MSTSTEDRLRAALIGAAEAVSEAPDAYQQAQRRWRKLELRRRAITVSVVLFLVVLACGAGVWVLSGASPGEHVIFDDHGHGSVTPRFPPGAP